MNAEKTPGQAGYEAHRASWWKRHGMDSGGLLPDGQWDAMAGADGAQDDWEAAAQAVIAQRQASCEAALADIIAAREMHADGEFADGDFVLVVFDALDVLAAQQKHGTGPVSGTTPGQAAAQPDDPYAGHEFAYESHTDLFRCTRCHMYEVTARADGPIKPCTGEPPAGSGPIEVNAW